MCSHLPSSLKAGSEAGDEEWLGLASSVIPPRLPGRGASEISQSVVQCVNRLCGRQGGEPCPWSLSDLLLLWSDHWANTAVTECVVWDTPSPQLRLCPAPTFPRAKQSTNHLSKSSSLAHFWLIPGLLCDSGGWLRKACVLFQREISNTLGFLISQFIKTVKDKAPECPKWSRF